MADIDGGDFGGPIYGFASSTVVDLRLLRADIYAQDLVWLEFSEPLVRNAALVNPASYTITGPGVTSVFEVFAGESDSPHPSSVLLAANGFQVGEEYTITVTGTVRSIDGSVMVPGQSAKFIARRTAIDGIISSLPRAYRTIPGSRIRGLINAIGRQIDLTKGSRRDYLP